MVVSLTKFTLRVLMGVKERDAQKHTVTVTRSIGPSPKFSVALFKNRLEYPSKSFFK